ncbi:SIR2 family protein [Fibrella forsythiae]|uniref:SIR2 family protein n=1 Tax=Fibrella forsythiae TaxID=2817061 RepID=A0ABS3JNW0_9BACT|nr:SIR2 family protein [Fibrella forsythiae]MBO0950612.1 SIR2 family protein [Fibrella forsythiae]
MPLTQRERFRLKISLATKYDKIDEIKRIIEHAELGKIPLGVTGKAIELWEQILKTAESRNRLASLVRKVAEESSDDDNFKYWLNELENGLLTRWEKLARSIADGHCLLFLGPGMLRCNVQEDGNDSPTLMVFNQAFAQVLAKEMYDSNVYFDEKATTNLPYIAQRYNEVKLPDINLLVKDIPGIQGKLAQEFYNSCQPDTRLYELIAQLPFKVIINTNPDDELATILNGQKPGQCVHRYYNITNADGAVHRIPELLGPGQTLLYNIFGWFGDRPSMILTETQLLDFTTRLINRNPALDPQVVNEFTVHENGPKSYLFLGFDFDQWYVKIMFQTVLKLIKEDNRSFSISPKGVAYNQFNREFFEEEFKCYFIDDDLTRLPDSSLKKLVDIYKKL